MLATRAFRISGVADGVVRQAWVETLNSIGYSPDPKRPTDQAASRSSIRKRFWRGDADTIGWTVSSGPSGVWLTCRIGLAPWRFGAALMWVWVAAELPARGVAMVSTARTAEAIALSALLVIVGLLSAVATVHLFAPCHRLWRVMHGPFADRLRASGGRIVDQRDRLLLPHLIGVAVLAAVVVPLWPVTWPIVRRIALSLDAISGALWSILGIGFVAVMVLMPSLMARRDIAWRLGTLNPSLWFVLAMLVWLLGPLAASLWGRLSPDDVSAWMMLDNWLRTSGQPVFVRPDGATVPRVEIAEKFGQLRVVAAATVVAATAVCPVLGAGMVILSVRSSRASLRSSRIISAGVAHGVFRNAAEARAGIWLARTALLTIWVGLVLALLLLAAPAYWAPIELLLAPVAHQPLGAFRASHFLLVLATGMQHTDPPITIAVIVAWWAWLGVPLGAWTWLVGRCESYRRRLERALRAACIVPAGEGRPTSSALADEAAMFGIRLAVVPSSGLACAHAFGLVRPRRFVEIGDVVLASLSEEECLAVLRHEIAHHQLGHCRWHVLLRWAGRITLVGAGFVGPLEDSYRFEHAADRYAVERLGASPRVLATALQKLRAIAVIEALGGRGQVPGPVGIDRVPVFAPAVESGRESGPWLQLFAADCEVAYWHPALEARIDRLMALAADGRDSG